MYTSVTEFTFKKVKRRSLMIKKRVSGLAGHAGNLDGHYSSVSKELADASNFSMCRHGCRLQSRNIALDIDD